MFSKALTVVVLALGVNISQNVFAQNDILSETLPVPLVSELVRDKLWKDEFDTQASGAELKRFWNSLKNQDKSKEFLIDELFGNLSPDLDKNAALPSPTLYSIKFRFLRYLLNNSLTDFNKAVFDAWKIRYVESALAMINMSGIDEIQPIAQNFIKKYKENKINIVDLSPTERERLSKIIKESHGVRVTTIDKRNGQFLVSGLYNAAQGYFALDFSRPISETLITFAHEMVHAGDPQIEFYYNEYQNTLPQVLEILKKWTLGVGIGEAVNFEGLDHSIDGSKLSELLKTIKESQDEQNRMLEARLAQHEKLTEQNAQLLKPTNEELAIINKWIRAHWGLTVENEYKAYGLSLVVYTRLKNKMGLLAPDPYRRKFLEAFADGDAPFILYLTASGIGHYDSVLFLLKDKFEKQGQKPNKDFEQLTNEEKLNISIARDYISRESQKVAHTFLSQLDDRYSKIINESDLSSTEKQYLLPDWARPGGFDLPTNPYKVITAKVGTIMTVRFRENLELIFNELKESIIPLINLSVGIFDFHDNSIGEMQLIGVFYTDAKYERIPEEIKANPILGAKLDSIPADVQKYFTTVPWTEETTKNPVPITGLEATRNLLKLRLLKAHNWLEACTPTLSQSVIGSKTFLQKLRDELYTMNEAEDDPENLTVERREALVKELLAGLETGSKINDNLGRMRLLMRELGKMYRISELDSNGDLTWMEVARKFQDKAANVMSHLDDLGINGKESFEDGKKKVEESRTSLLKQIQAKTKRLCGSDKAKIYSESSESPSEIDIEGHQFPLMLFCHNSKIYGARQPGDYTKFMTKLTTNGVPEIRIFMGHRAIQVSPIIFERKK